MKQNRLKSKAMWVGIVSALFLAYNSVADNYGLPKILEGAAEPIVNFIFGLLAMFSAINNPTNKDNI
jgi:phi LC3 family holin